MNVFFLELWHDLREKRLVPVAAVLALAVVAVPAVMLKSSSGGGGTDVAPAQPAGSAEDLLPVQLSNSDDKGSRLKTFDPKNPFKPGIKVGGVPGSTVVSRAGSSLPATTGGGGEAPKAGGTGGGGSSPSTPGTTSPGPTTRTPRTRTARFTYVIDVTFVKNGRSSRRKGLRRLAMLPNRNSPLLLFLGVDSKAENALFLVDSTLKTFGEGSCRPSASECGVLKLGSGAEHEFTDADNNSYGLRIDEIRRVSTARAAKAAKAARARAKSSARTSAAKRRFVPPFLTDVETETTTGATR